jgi:hypothetical protein
MSPKEKAIELVDKFQFEITEYPTRLYEDEIEFRKAKQCALIAVDEIIAALSSFGYNGIFYDDFETGKITLNDDKDPCFYWNEVKNEIQKL